MGNVRNVPRPEGGRATLDRGLRTQMKAAAKDLEFEKAAMLRDQIMVDEDALSGPTA